ncbi:MAG TPA: glutamate 5-kinase [Victivallales bacterium]|nr:glutamate 5-kinase [Victivallales bacterium]HPO90430.1 glutamate 5-kinase [Victivallales bacterium]HRR06649.1 glutamate 5-kinase [Victivallales bacterium]HRR28656.1 glutamate 5-kinase [Victivallales bacterium]HRU01185.1 glutamate 5-kinase [Victivallales bacterium]
MYSDKSDFALRKIFIEEAKKIVIKVGTRLLTDTFVVSQIISQIAYLKSQKKEIILVSSGAVGLGMKTLNLIKRPNELSKIQALAAIGQSKLMSLYEKEAGNFGFHCAQILLGSDDLNNRQRHLNVMNCLNALLKMEILPIINENDSVSVDELKFGDNDSLAALIAVMTRADLTIILTTVDGLMSSLNSDGKLIPIVRKIDSSIKGLASDTNDKDVSIGGMSTKIKAAQIVTASGEPLLIANGKTPNIIQKIFSLEEEGTLFVPSKKQINSKKRWLGFFSKSKGKLYVDDGAVKAIKEKNKSLLPSGIKKISGNFETGDTIDICSINGDVFARGLVNYNSKELLSILGKKSSEIYSILGYIGDDEIVHKDNLTLI